MRGEVREFCQKCADFFKPGSHRHTNPVDIMDVAMQMAERCIMEGKKACRLAKRGFANLQVIHLPVTCSQYVWPLDIYSL